MDNQKHPALTKSTSTTSQLSSLWGGQARFRVEGERLQQARAKARNSTNVLSGMGALRDMAKPTGAWNWVLLGMDPEKMPLSGSGSGGVQEMQDNLDKHASTVGVLRMSFGSVDKWLFITTTTMKEEEEKTTALQKGQQLAMEKKMKAKVSEVVTTSVDVHVSSKWDFTPDFLISCLKPVVSSFQAEQITLENYLKALEAQDKAEEASGMKSIKTTCAAVLDFMEMEVPHPLAAEPQMEEPTTSAAEAPLAQATRQRKKLKIFSVGDPVEIFSASQGVWLLDGEIVEVLKEEQTITKIRVRAGSMKVLYDRGRRFKWVAMQQMEECIRPSPRPPPPEAMFGSFQVETYGWWYTSWSERYVELTKGWLQLWTKRESAAAHEPALDSVYLLDLQVSEEGDILKFRVDSGQGAVYTCKFASAEECTNWADKLSIHTAYCDEAREYFAAQTGGATEREQLVNAMRQHQKQRANLAEGDHGTASMLVEDSLGKNGGLEF